LDQVVTQQITGGLARHHCNFSHSVFELTHNTARSLREKTGHQADFRA
jgi:hypothetical protein